ncbi:MAG: glycosyltransferase family 2 protein [Bacteroidales bacterium]|nr:glycosyltransferase family 2 protein [Bacteroidales bacterium]
MTLSIVLPAFSEQENISYMYNELVALDLGPVKIEEMIFVDDGSTDQTFEKVKSLAKKDKRVRGLRFSRNFGKQVALMAGLHESTGEITITMDTDGQHPPSFIIDLLNEYEKGYDIVNTTRSRTAHEGWLKRVTSRGFYRILNVLSDLKMEAAAAEFRLMNRAALDAYLNFDEREPYQNGLVSWMGFRQSTLSFEAPERHAGITKFNLRKLFSHGLNGIISFSTRPLRISFTIGLIVMVISLAYGAYAILNYFFGTTNPGWTSLMFVILFLGSVQLFSIGIIGEYIARLFRESKKRPHFFIQERC